LVSSAGCTLRETVLAPTQIGRAAKPEEMVGMVLFVASPLASFATRGVTRSTRARRLIEQPPKAESLQGLP
jgi:NAD(P)-dependent dehydrogenase (short-subunit alcohol dehydrogenase family)